ncbi:putative ompA-like autotransporter [Orientia tsutsugamushi str. TA763]|nr:putative ompA-like autotransporter [Orientia tsutsugamushi str. TA763]
MKSLLQPCYAVILAFVVLSSQSIYSADRYNNSENSKSSIESNAFPFYIKFSTALDTNYYYIFEGGVGYRLDRHRMDVGFGFYCINKFIQGNYYYNIIEGNKASIFVTGGLESAFNSDSGTV